MTTTPGNDGELQRNTTPERLEEHPESETAEVPWIEARERSRRETLVYRRGDDFVGGGLRPYPILHLCERDRGSTSSFSSATTSGSAPLASLASPTFGGTSKACSRTRIPVQRADTPIASANRGGYFQRLHDRICPQPMRQRRRQPMRLCSRGRRSSLGLSVRVITILSA